MRKFVFPFVSAFILALSCENAPEEIAVTEVTISQPTAELIVGENVKLSATVKPSDATGQSISWISSSIGIATVTNDGLVTAVAEGKATIKAVAGGKSASCIVTVSKKPVPVSSVTLNKTSLDLTKGESKTLTATVTPADATNKTVSWTSSSPSIASVDSKGKVTGTGNGSTTITAKAEDKEATCTVTVTVPIESISLNKTELTLDKGQSETLIAIIKPDDATEKTVTWFSADPGVAAVVVTSGKVIAMGGGQTTVSAKVRDQIASCTVSVQVPVESIILNRTDITLEEGESATLKATVTPKDADDQTITWSSSDESIISVDQNGTIHAIKQGSADILAKAGGKQAICSATVTKSVTSVTLDKTSLTLLIGETSTLTATVLPDDATDKTIRWDSSNPGIATVENGAIKGVGIGETVVTASAGFITARCNVSVIIDSPAGVYAVYDDNYSIVEDMVKPGSELDLGLVNYSSETIHVVSVQLINGQTGAIGFEMVLDDDISSCSSASWTVTTGDSGINSPLLRFVYTFKGESYTCETRLTPIPKAPRRH
ncbi:MAG: Ig-like domain-containing protein [Bacteroidales bacterium]|nr:Ig-like domain-containing protein [Bacteroidales bacterium]